MHDRRSMHRDTETFQVSSLQEAEHFAEYISRYGESTSHDMTFATTSAIFTTTRVPTPRVIGSTASY